MVILTSLLFGAGAAFYALAWLLLPDETDDRILCEELINGHWDWNCLGALICAAAAICLPGAGAVAADQSSIVCGAMAAAPHAAAAIPATAGTAVGAVDSTESADSTDPAGRPGTAVRLDPVAVCATAIAE